MHKESGNDHRKQLRSTGEELIRISKDPKIELMSVEESLSAPMCYTCKDYAGSLTTDIRVIYKT